MGTDLKSTGMCLEAGRELQCTKQKTSPTKSKEFGVGSSQLPKKIFLGPSLQVREGNCMGD